MHVVDLSIPVRDGDGRLGLKVKFETPYRFEDCGWQGSTVSMFCHYATHVDAPNHFIEGGSGIDEVPLAKADGSPPPSSISPTTGRTPGSAATRWRTAVGTSGRWDIAILRTGWSDRCWGEAAFWSEGPYLRADGATWLVERGVNAVVYDFSEEEAVRGGAFRGEDCVVHHTLLGEDIYNIEYVHRLPAIRADRLAIVALPIKLSGLDGAPARVLAIEGFDLPREFELTT